MQKLQRQPQTKKSKQEVKGKYPTEQELQKGQTEQTIKKTFKKKTEGKQ